MSVANYIEILRKIERDAASRGEWCKLSRNMIAALPERLYRQSPVNLLQNTSEKHIVRPMPWTEGCSNPECSSSESSEDKNDNTDNDLDKHAKNHGCPSRSPGTLTMVPSEIEHEVLAFINTMRVCETPWIHGCPRILWPKRKSAPFETRTDRVRINAFRALKDFTQTPFGNGMSGLRSETRFDLSAKKVGIDGELVKVDSWRLAESAYDRLDWKTGAYDVKDFDIYDDEDGQLEIYGPKGVDDVDLDDQDMEDVGF